jgi:hypothetical protein
MLYATIQVRFRSRVRQGRIFSHGTQASRLPSSWAFERTILSYARTRLHVSHVGTGLVFSCASYPDVAHLYQ